MCCRAAPEALLRPLNSYVPVMAYERVLEQSMTDELCGVHVFTLPSGAGKTTAVTRVANRLFSQGHTAGTVYVDLRHEWMRNAAPNLVPSLTGMIARSAGLQVQPEYLFHVGDASLLPPAAKPVIFIADHADSVILKGDTLRADLVSLANKSVMTKRFIVILLFRNAHVARVVSAWNAHQKLKLRPRADNVAGCHPTEHELIHAVLEQDLCEQLTPSALDKFCALALLSRSMNYIANGAALLRALPQRVHEVDVERLLTFGAAQTAAEQSAWHLAMCDPITSNGH